MTLENWKEYEIICRVNMLPKNAILFFLNDWVEYSYGSKKEICCTDTNYFRNWMEGDKIKINNEKTKQRSDFDTFGFYDNVVFICKSNWENKCFKNLERFSKELDKAINIKRKLEGERDEWRRKFYDKDNDYEDEKEKREELQKRLDQLQSERVNESRKNNDDKLKLVGENSQLITEKTRLQERLEVKSARLTGVAKELEDAKEEVRVVRREKEDQLIMFKNKFDQKQQLLENVRQSLEDLKIKHEREKAEKNSEVKEKDSELKAKEEELKRKEEEVKKSQRKAGQSREELLSERSRLKEEKLKAFAVPLGVSLSQINNLRRCYERLTDARKNCNQANIETHEDNIARIEEELSQNKVSIDNIQKVCHQCEKLVKMRVELNEIRQQQFQSQQEVPLRNNF